MFIPLQGCTLALRLNQAPVLEMDSKRPLATPEGRGSGQTVAATSEEPQDQAQQRQAMGVRS